MVLWHTAGPRASAVYDVTGDGKTAAKASYGRYYYLLPTGGSAVNLVNPNANYFTTYTWNDVNNDLKFQPGEQTGAGVLTTGTTTTIDPNFSRPYTDEYSFGVDRELMANFKMSAAYTYRRERYLQASANPDNPYATTPTTAIEPGIDGVLGTGDDGTYSFFQRISAANRTLITNDPNSPAELQRVGNHADQAPLEPLADARRVHLREEPDRELSPSTCHRTS